MLTGVSVTWVMVSYPNSRKQSTALAQDNGATPSPAAIQTERGQLSNSNNNPDNLSFNRYSKQENTVPADITLPLPDRSVIVNNDLIEPGSLQMEDNTGSEPGVLFRTNKPAGSAFYS